MDLPLHLTHFGHTQCSLVKYGLSQISPEIHTKATESGTLKLNGV